MVQFPTHIELLHVPNFGDSISPARCQRSTGKIWINDSLFWKLKPEHRLFILLHESAHIALNSSDEVLVDQQAQKWFIEMGYSITESVKALTQVLIGENPQHNNRMVQQLERGFQIDKKNNTKKMNDYNFFEDIQTEGYDSINNYDELFGLGKKARERAASKNRTREMKAQATLELAKQGIVNKSSAVTDTIKSVAKSATSIFTKQPVADEAPTDNGGGYAPQDNGGGYTPPPAPTKSNKKVLLYVGIGAGVLAVVGLIIFLVKRK